MCAWRVETIRILTRIEQHADDVGVTELRGERERTMTIFRAGRGQHPPHVIDASETRGGGDSVDPRAAPDQCLGCVMLAEHQRGLDRRRPVPFARRRNGGAVIDEHID
jgi:hypothetical protein